MFFHVRAFYDVILSKSSQRPKTLSPARRHCEVSTTTFLQPVSRAKLFSSFFSLFDIRSMQTTDVVNRTNEFLGTCDLRSVLVARKKNIFRHIFYRQIWVPRYVRSCATLRETSKTLSPGAPNGDNKHPSRISPRG